MKTILTGDGRTLSITPQTGFFKQNTALAMENKKIFTDAGIIAVDILGSVGAGKTTLAGALVAYLKGQKRLAAIAGDLTTEIDAQRIRAQGAEVLQINTDKGCHLDANMIKNAMDCLNLSNLDIVLIENVGNLICPSGYQLGAHHRMVVISVTEGPYQVVKHPHIFQDVSVVVINKIDLADVMEVDPQKLIADIHTIRPGIPVILTNGRTGQGIAELATALKLDK
ncbi:hydrogenase nickel incorporation protein HypB [bacterium]|nr:hydrogenase nickel incorporation protein HypB [bacterium]